MAILGTWSQQLITSKPPTERLGTVNQEATIQDLSADNPTATTVDVEWTVVPNTTGEDLRWSTSPITPANFAFATQSPTQPTLQPAGTTQNITVTGLPPATLIYFAVQMDLGLSNNATETTLVAAVITDLTASGPTGTTMNLQWTVVTGTTSEVLRWSTSPITPGNFGSATLADPQPSLLPPGSTQNITVLDLPSDTLIYFAVLMDAGLSNVASEATLDITAPDAVTLTCGGSTSSTATLDWIAVGDDGSIGTATSYDLRQSTSPITDANFSSATSVTPAPPAPSAPGTPETHTVTGLTANTVYYFAMKVEDEVPNQGPLSNVLAITTLPALPSKPVIHLVGVPAPGKIK